MTKIMTTNVNEKKVMTVDRIYRDKKYYIKYDGAIRACKVVYYKASIDCDYEVSESYAVLNVAGKGNILFRTERSSTPSDLPSYVKRESVLTPSRMPKLYPSKDATKNTELNLNLYSWNIRDAMKARNLMDFKHDHDSRYLMKCYTWTGYDIKENTLSYISFHGTYDFLKDSFDICVGLSEKYYPTIEQCIADNRVTVVDFDEEDNEDFAEQKREEFREYVAHHAPDFEDKINWEYFQNSKSMPWNLSEQIRLWCKNY